MLVENMMNRQRILGILRTLKPDLIEREGWFCRDDRFDFVEKMLAYAEGMDAGNTDEI